MARFIYQNHFKDRSGNVISSGTVSVYLNGTTTAASVYTASSGGTAVNSVTSDASGLFYFYVDRNDYDGYQKFKITLSKSGFNSQTYDDIAIFPDRIEYNVLDYGADNTGATDASTEINAAITDANAAGGGIVVLPNGTYLLDATIQILQGVILQGAGYECAVNNSFAHANWAAAGAVTGTVLKPSANTIDAITFTNSAIKNQVSIRDLAILGIGAGASIGINHTNAALYTARNGELYHHIGIFNYSTGVSMSDVISNAVYSLDIRGCTTGLLFNDNNTDTSFHRLSIENCDTGIKFSWAKQISIFDGLIQTNTLGIDFAPTASGDVYGLLFDSVWFESNTNNWSTDTNNTNIPMLYTTFNNCVMGGSWTWTLTDTTVIKSLTFNNCRFNDLTIDTTGYSTGGSFTGFSVIGGRFSWFRPGPPDYVYDNTFLSVETDYLAQYNTNIVRTARRSFTTAQVNALKATPLTIIKSGSSQQIIEVLGILFHYTYHTTEFTPNGAVLRVQYADTHIGLAQVDAAGFLDQTTDIVLLIKHPFVRHGSITYDPANILDGDNTTTTVTVTGAALGDAVVASFDKDLKGCSLTGYVSSANTVTIVLNNNTGGAQDIDSGTLVVRTLTNSSSSIYSTVADAIEIENIGAAETTGGGTSKLDVSITYVVHTISEYIV